VAVRPGHGGAALIEACTAKIVMVASLALFAFVVTFGFMIIGSEWFRMWQSHSSNG